MRIEEIIKVRKQVYQIAARHGVTKVFVFGSVARGESNEISDIDFLVEMEESASALGVGAFQYEVQQLLGIRTDVIPSFALNRIEDQSFVQAVEHEAVAL
jgi:uncharacterized protein